MHRCVLRLLLPVLFCTSVACLPAAAQRTRGPDQKLSKGGDTVREAFKSVVANANPATVRVICNGKYVCLGTAIAENGLILTKASEIEGETRVALRTGRTLPATVVGVAEDHDLALLKVDAKLRSITWSDADDAEVGQWVVTPGLADVPEAVGVISVGRRRIPPRSGLLGVMLADGEGGAKVMQVVPNSPAEKAGIHVDDLINRVNDAEVAGKDGLVSAIRGYMPGQTVTLGIRRGEKSIEAKAKLVGGIGPGARAEMMNQMGGPLSLRNANFPSVLQHDTVLKPELCGGPLIDLDGKAVGINIARAGRVESYAIPADVIQKLLPDLMSGKLAPKSQHSPTTTKAESKNEK